LKSDLQGTQGHWKPYASFWVVLFPIRNPY